MHNHSGLIDWVGLWVCVQCERVKVLPSRLGFLFVVGFKAYMVFGNPQFEHENRQSLDARRGWQALPGQHMRLIRHEGAFSEYTIEVGTAECPAHPCGPEEWH